MKRFNELLEKRRNLTADIFDEEELIVLSKNMTEQQLIGIDKELLSYSNSDRLDKISSLLDKLNDVIDKINMKNFLLFTGDIYYPKGGAYDFKGSFISVDEAIKAYTPKDYDFSNEWANIFDLKQEKIIKHFREDAWHDGDIKI